MQNYKKIHKKWLDNIQLTEQEKNTLLNLTNTEIKTFFSDKKLYFGTSGIRELVGLGTTRINRFTVRSISLAYATFLKQTWDSPKIIVFGDNRKNREEFIREITSIAYREGMEVYISPQNRPYPTPVLSFLIPRMNLSGGINITASHNPMEYNGIKLYDQFGKQLSKPQQKQIVKNLAKPQEIIDIPPSSIPITKEIEKSWMDLYFENIQQNTPPMSEDKSIKVLFSSHHGTTSQIMKKLAHKMGFTNFMEFEQECNITWETNKEETINPENPKSFDASIKKAEELGIGHVFASDPDGDRCAIAEKQKDGSWYFFNGNEIGIVSAYFKHKFQTIKNPYIVISKVTGNFLSKIFPKIPIHLTSVGFKNISQKIDVEESKGNNLLIGFEESIGSLLIPMHREKDSFQQTALSLEIISYLNGQNLTIKEFLETLFKKFGYWRGFTDSYIMPKTTINKILNLKAPGVKKVEWDNRERMIVWTLNKDNWIKFRYSGTEPKLKVYYNFFGKDPQEIKRLEKQYKELIEKFLETNL